MKDPNRAKFYRRVGELVQGTHGCSIKATASAFADLLERDDPGFDRQQFYRNCGLDTKDVWRDFSLAKPSTHEPGAFTHTHPHRRRRKAGHGYGWHVEHEHEHYHGTFGGHHDVTAAQ